MICNALNNQSLETASRLITARVEGQGNEKRMLMVHVSLWGDKNVLKSDSSYGHMILWLY